MYMRSHAITFGICFAFQTAILLLRIDDIVSGTKKQLEALSAPAGGAAAPQAQPAGPED
jgi:hypothetical protein